MTVMSPLPLSFPTRPVFHNSNDFSLIHSSLRKTNIASLTSSLRRRNIELRGSNRLRTIYAVTGEDVSSIESTSQGMSAAGDDSISTTIQALLFAAFAALTVLTIGVIYIGITDFLGKREREKFEKEEAAKKSKGRKKRITRAKAGPRGFGQKPSEDDD